MPSAVGILSAFGEASWVEKISTKSKGRVGKEEEVYRKYGKTEDMGEAAFNLIYVIIL